MSSNVSSNDDLTRLTLADAARCIRRKEISPVALTRAYLERIERLDGRLNSYITLMADAALERARQAEAALQRGEAPGALAGVPLALKDLFETRGVRTTAGAKFFADYVPAADAAVVEKLYAAGAIVLGKTNMHEIALGLTTVNPHYGACHNPWNRECVPGGSSGGSAAALAARLCAGALGTDTGGSIRVPAALCGIVGLKPTFGRVSVRGVIPLSWNLDHVGPMARRVEDAAILLQVIAGYDAQDPYSQDVSLDDYTGSLGVGIQGWRVALAQGEYFERTQPEVWQAVLQASQVFADLGAVVEPVELPGIYQAAMSNGMMTTSDAAAFHAERLLERPSDFGADVLQRLQAGQDLPLKDYIQARRIQTLARHQFQQLFTHYDVLLMPTTAVAAPPIQGPTAIEMARLLTRYTAPFNLTGLPALSLPCGFTPDHLPVGLELIGPAWAEARLLRAGYAYEQATRWTEIEPVLE